MKTLTLTLIARDEQDEAEINRDFGQIASSYPCFAWDVRDLTATERTWLAKEYDPS